MVKVLLAWVSRAFLTLDQINISQLRSNLTPEKKTRALVCVIGYIETQNKHTYKAVGDRFQHVKSIYTLECGHGLRQLSLAQECVASLATSQSKLIKA